MYVYFYVKRTQETQHRQNTVPFLFFRFGRCCITFVGCVKVRKGFSVASVALNGNRALRSALSGIDYDRFVNR